ncbi:MAG: glycosyltransferase family 2 protein [Candidatus Azobacteroides pseudotrichonymphae]|jgi:GT2 family glycosyltransferase|uniref:Glycosyltransferase n=1 Tax=Azobacteroides pseudotrichonymphae genomovar. CFP2 TaxID=511995 RepID=B6YS13_AZOPC|nr:glycosyltransferase family 2 protein [Candidatus Azobacteroides pseudotrichonymphae]MDR0530413.1 glycosyltransferase family 2 protein [Bacteroidales bacterium OttesenSCG-928-I14]BAG83985.1 putative glycosyltransferase [Candidatus Azobacteroides pseudotrichonymphae genomovar. CFP2]GMO33834.1 MAG: glycosyltransferase family 2 protein [Candidatus Azobacteroides pseudotrichonymphae]
MKQTAILILNWNGRKLLERFLPSLLMHVPVENVDIIVVDNGSTDDSLKFLHLYYPTLIVRVLGENYGFAEGYNRVLLNLDYEFIVLLNSDVEVGENWFCPAINYLETHKDVVALQPKILSFTDKSLFEYAGASGGFLDKYGYPFCRGRIFCMIEKDEGQYDNPIQIFWASGACLFIRLEDFKMVGGFDSAFFVHQEEIDLCWRLNLLGKKIICLPCLRVYHVGGATLDREHPQKIYLNFRNNLLMLYKNLPDISYDRVMVIRFFLDYLFALCYLLKGRFRNAFAIWKARLDFRRLKKQHRVLRSENREVLPTIFRGCIVWQYYFRGKKKWNSLNIS